MFSRRAEESEAAPAVAGDISIIEDGLVFSGTTVTTGKLHVEGEIKGDVTCAQLSIGNKGRVNGAVVAEEVVISGRFEGTISAGSVNLKPSSHVDGDITYNSLEIEHGAHYEGTSKRTEKPIPEKGKAKPAPAAKAGAGETGNGKLKQHPAAARAEQGK